MTEAIERFDCFGGRCEVYVIGEGPASSAAEAAGAARSELSALHLRFSRFIAESELSRVNRDPRTSVRVSAMMARLACAVRFAGELSSGLVDATQVSEIERAGYARDLGEPLALARALELAPARRPARPDERARWQLIDVDPASSTLTRPAGVLIDSGGLAKGLFADALAERLAGHRSFAVNCGGDLMIGGSGALSREVEVQSPFDASTLHSFQVSCGAAATSGIGRRSWLTREGAPAHHLLDPASGLPAFTGVVQATALAPTALLAEIRAKAAVLAGPHAASRWLPHGGLIVLEDGSHRVIDAPQQVSLRELSAYA